MSAMTALPPPNDNSDSGAKTRPSAMRLPPDSSLMSAAARLDQREANAERCEHGDDRKHRPAQDPDAQHGRGGERQPAEAGPALNHAVQPGGEGQPDDRSGHPVEHPMQDPVLAEPGIEGADPQDDRE